MGCHRFHSWCYRWASNIMGILSLILQVLNGPVGETIDKYFDNAKEKEAFKNAVQLEVLKNEKQIQDLAGSIILAEAKSEHTITAIWRPLLMLIIVFIVGWNYAFIPVLGALGFDIAILDLPPQLWTLLTVGVGGYTVGRSAEKSMRMYAQHKSKPRLEDF